MPTVVTDPLGDLIQGALQGYGLGMHLKNQQMQQEAHKRAMAAADREAQVKDIQTQMMLEQNARPVNAGTVQDALPAAPIPSGGPMGDVTKNLFPQIQGGEPQAPIVRPVDKSRRVKYGQQEYELLTPEEQLKSRVDQAQQMKRADAVPIQTPQHLRELGMPETIWVPNDHLMQYANTTGQLAPVDTPSTYQEMGGPAKVPYKNLPSVVSAVGQALGRKDANTRADNANKTREQIAADNRAAANSRADKSNATRIQAASIRRDQPTANAEGVQNRFQQRQIESDQKTLRDLESKEAKLHAEKLETGQMSPGKNDDPKQFVSKRDARLSALDLQIKGIQESKKKLIQKWGGMWTEPVSDKPGAKQQTTAIPANPYR